MDSTALRMFLAVAEEGGVTRAAEKLHCVQSNVTSHIRKLEKQLGVVLFHRNRRGMVPTAAGLQLLPYARSVKRLLEEAQAALRPAGCPSGLLRLGAMDTAAAVHLPAILASYHRQYPEVELRLATGASSEMVRQVLDFTVEGALVGGPVHHNDIVGEEILVEELVAISCATNCRLQPKDCRTVLVYRQGCSCRRRFEDWLAAARCVPDNVIEFGTLDAILSCVAAGMGVTVLPRSFVDREPYRSLVSLHPLPGPFAQLPIFFVQRRGVAPPEALELFLRLLRNGLAPGDQG